MIWTTKYGKVVLYLPEKVSDAEEIEMAEEAIKLQLKSWRRGMESEIASRWPFPSPSGDKP